MANRFTDTDKWKKKFLRGLKGPYKLLWLYICDDCNHAGVWDVDMEVAAARTGEELNLETALQQLEEKIVVFDSGAKWFIPSFIEFQYPTGLNPANKAHASVIKILNKYNLTVAPSKPLESPLEGAMVMDIDKDMDKVKEDRGMGKGIAVNMVQIFKTHFPSYPVDQKVDFSACLEIAYKIADAKGWTRESVVNGKMAAVAIEWERLVVFAHGDRWYCTRAISDLNREFQRLIQSANNGSKTHFGGRGSGTAGKPDPEEIGRTGAGSGF